MNRRSAITIAAGLVLTMVVAGGAIALGMTGPSQADAADPAQSTSVTRPSPEVRTITRTVRVERDDDAGSVTSPAAGVTTASPVAVGATPAPWDDDARNDDDDDWDDERGDDSDDGGEDADDDSDDGSHSEDDGSDDDDDSDDDHGADD